MSTILRFLMVLFCAFLALIFALLKCGLKKPNLFLCYFFDTLALLCSGLFPKVCQILSTRGDLFNKEGLKILSSWQSEVKSKTVKFGIANNNVMSPLGAGTIALTFTYNDPNLGLVVVKKKRWNIDNKLSADLKIIHLFSWLGKGVPQIRALNVLSSVNSVIPLLKLQTNFSVEAENLMTLRENLLGQSRIPKVLEGSTNKKLIMEYIPTSYHLLELNEFEDRKRVANELLITLYQMIFVDGFIHCDLHPGNVYLDIDKALVIVDAGFCVKISSETSFDIKELFLSVALRRPIILSDLILKYSEKITQSIDKSNLVRDCNKLLKVHSGLVISEFRLVNFIKDLNLLYSKYSLVMKSDFFIVIYSILVVEGTLDQLNPGLDFQAEALNYMVQNRSKIG